MKEGYFVKTNGTIWPKCMLSLLGPRPVYKKNGFPCSYRSRILSNSLNGVFIINDVVAQRFTD